ncbi:unnamed protein product [Fusarium langsethiae]|nr:unnamed protein product [Fusarium langsethiae]
MRPCPKRAFSCKYTPEQHGQTFDTATGIVGDEHVAKSHGGTERAVHQYNPDHYPDWQAENAPEPKLYDVGAFRENLVTTNMNDDNVCIGDIYKLGDEVSEPRHPCYKLNSRFKWPRALKRTIRTWRSGSKVAEIQYKRTFDDFIHIDHGFCLAQLVLHGNLTYIRNDA